MKYIELESNFSTADAEDPIIQFDGSDLSIKFENWQEETVCIVFKETDMFAWQQIHGDFTEAPDNKYQVLDSEWLTQAKEYEPELKHYKLCFNASYYALDVLASSLEIK